MKRDYKFLADHGKTPAAGVRPGKHHLVILAAIIMGLAAVFSMAPDDAGATRGAALYPVKQTRLPTGQAISNVSATLSLPPESGSPPAAATPAPETAVQQGTWHTLTVKPGDNLAQIFARLGLSAGALHEIMQLGDKVAHLKNLFPGERLRFRIDGDNTLLELVHKADEVHSLRVVKKDDGYQATEIRRTVETRTAHTTGAIDQSLFLAAQDAGLSDNMTMQLAAIFGWDIDFALDIRQGDRFTVVYEEKFLDGRKIGDGDIVAAEFSNRGTTYRAIRYTDSRGHTDYYSPDGRSLRKAFLRTPVKFSRISSRFDPHRRHPILNRIRAHKGVDYAARRGTPIRATGDGKIIFKGRKGGYGRTIVIRHGSRYSTLYAHMSAYNRKVRVSGRVRQGQIIGYVGRSGLATGPHLHYEFRINGVHRNPLTVKLPMAKPIAKRYRDNFQHRAAPLVAQLDLLQRSQVARN